MRYIKKGATLTIKTPAKINLFLDIIKKDKTGFHQIKTLFQAVSLFDEIKIKKASKTRIVVNRKEFQSRHNIVENVIALYRKKYRVKENFIVKIKKQIPVGAGLGGGSSNAAAVIWGINRLSGLGLHFDELLNIAQELGKDIAFFFTGGTQFGSHYGEKLKSTGFLANYYILLIYPGFGISTTKSYAKIDKTDFNKGKKLYKQIQKAVNNNDYIHLADSLYNIFEKNAFEQYPVLKQIKQDLIDNGAHNALMSVIAKNINKKLKTKYKKAILLEPCYYGLINV